MDDRDLTGLAAQVASPRSRSWRGRALGRALLFAPGALIVATDVAGRRERFAALLAARDGASLAAYAGGAALSAALWAALLLLVAHRRRAVALPAAAAFVALGTFLLGAQRYFFAQYATYMNLDAVLFGTSMPASLAEQILADLAHLVRAELPVLATAAALVVVARRAVRPRAATSRAATLVAPAAFAAATLLPCAYRTVQASTPDVLLLHALGGLAKARARGATGHVEPGVRRPELVPALAPSPARPRNVLLVMTESVRFDAACEVPGEACDRTPFTHALLPGRMPLLQMRANDSTTAISAAVLWSGLPPTGTREAIHAAPLLFDYARAAGWDSAYWTSQHMMFANAHLWIEGLPVSHRCSATDLDPDAHIDLGADDAKLTARVASELDELREPWVAVVQYSNTHFPYAVDPDEQPFQPATQSKAPEDTPAFRNHYQNAVWAQDRTIADLVKAVRASRGGSRTVVLFTSDHGEAFREHGQLGHTQAVFDEEIHVPFWIDAPDESLAPAEREALVAARDAPAFHLDVTPTVLDLMGVWDDAALARFRARMPGRTLLRPGEDAQAMPLTNCTELWGCAFRNWGMMRGTRKLEAREWDFAWHCWDVASDPAEKTELGAAACGDLAALAAKTFGTLPKDAAPMPEQ